MLLWNTRRMISVLVLHQRWKTANLYPPLQQVSRTVRVAGMLEPKVPVAQAPGIEVSTTVARHEIRAISRVHLLLHSRHAAL